MASCAPAFVLGATVSAIGQGVPTSGVALTTPELGADYAAKGLPMGAFRLFPTLDVALDVDDNIYRTQTGAISDTFFEVTPRVALASQWAQHYLLLRAGATDYEYSSHGKESRTDWDLGAEGRLDVMRGTFLAGGMSYRQTFEPRASPDQLNVAASPTPFNVFHADGRIESKPERLGVSAGVNYDKYQYDRTQLIPSGSFSNRDRDYSEVELFGRLSYEFSPGYSTFAHFSYNTRNFDLALDRNGVNRDSDGYRANLGLLMEITRLITGEFYAGYQIQNYKAPLNQDKGFNYGANITWSPTPLVAVHLDASHSINETVVASIGGVATDSNEQRVGVGIDYGFRPNIILHANGAYLYDTFTGSGRLDKLALFGVGGTYLINNYMSANVAYTYSDRNSNITGQDFSDNSFRIGLGFQL